MLPMGLAKCKRVCISGTYKSSLLDILTMVKLYLVSSNENRWDIFEENEVEWKRTVFCFEISYELKVIKERERVGMINDRIYTRDRIYIVGAWKEHH